jgi:hypothetical protein
MAWTSTHGYARAANPAHPASPCAKPLPLYLIVDSHLQISNAVPHAFFMRHSL